MKTTEQDILDNQQQFEEMANQLNKLKSNYASLIHSFKILNTYEPLDNYNKNLLELYHNLIALDINKDLTPVKALSNNLNEKLLENWFAALEKKQKYFSANSKAQKRNFTIAIAITLVVFSLALLSAISLGGTLGLCFLIGGVIVSSLMIEIAAPSFEKRFKENNRDASRISESKNNFVSFFNSQKSNSQNENDKKIEPELRPV